MKLEMTVAGALNRYPFGQMQIGDYLIVPRRLAKRASAAAYIYGGRRGMAFSCRLWGTRGRMKITRIDGRTRPHAQ